VLSTGITNFVYYEKEMVKLNPVQFSELAARKAEGRDLLNNCKVKEALQVYSDILKEFPDDVEILLILGDLYLTAGDETTALKLYASALKYDAGNLDIIQRVQLAAPEFSAKGLTPPENVTTLKNNHPTNEPPNVAINSVLQNLIGSQNTINEGDIERAARLMHSIINHQSPAQEVAEHLEEIDSLLPALIELNIRQARDDGRPDLAEGLTNLQTNINLQLNARKTSFEETQSQTTLTGILDIGQPVFEKTPHFSGKVLILTSDCQEISSRMTLVKEALIEQSCQVSVSSGGLLQGEKPDIVIASNPHTSPLLLESIAGFSAMQTPVILDLDVNFEELPDNHPLYQVAGLGNPVVARSYMAAMLLANLITVPTPIMAESFHAAGYPVKVLPDGWLNKNSLWKKTASPRSSINIGWVNTCGLKEDIAQIRRIIIRVIHEFPQTQLVIIGDSKAYQLFDNLPESRKLFLPAVALEDYPFLFSQIDLLLVPLRNIPFNRAQSDIALVEAGAKSIPWVASPIPAFKEWKAGGLLADSVDEWHTCLRHLVMDPDFRVSLGQAGAKKASERELNPISHQWISTIDHLLAKKIKVNYFSAAENK